MVTCGLDLVILVFKRLNVFKHLNFPKHAQREVIVGTMSSWSGDHDHTSCHSPRERSAYSRPKGHDHRPSTRADTIHSTKSNRNFFIVADRD